MTSNLDLQKYRGGCIICMDYGAYSGNYDFLLVNFKEIAEILTAKLFALKDYDFLSCTAYIFGFSIGSRIVAQAGNDFGPQQIERIDCKTNVTPKKNIPQLTLNIYQLSYSMSD